MSTERVVSKTINLSKEVARNYISMDVVNGLKIAQSNPSSATSNYVQINNGGIKIAYDGSNYTTVSSEGLSITQNSEVKANFGSTISIYQPGTEIASVYIDSNGAIFTGTLRAESLLIENNATFGGEGARKILNSELDYSFNSKLDLVSQNGMVNWNGSTFTITSANPETNEQYAVEVGGQTGIRFKYKSPEAIELATAASIDKDKLIITKTVVLDEMQVGTGKWSWKLDPYDNSIYLKWIGE